MCVLRSIELALSLKCSYYVDEKVNICERPQFAHTWFGETDCVAVRPKGDCGLSLNRFSPFAM